MRSLQQYLVGVSLTLVLLMCAAAALLINEVDRFSRAQSERQLLATARALSLVVDGQLRRYEATLNALASSESLQREDWAAVDRLSRKLLPGTDAWIAVGSRAGRQVVNTRLPPGTPLPAGPLPEPVWEELERGGARICPLSRGLVERRILCVDLPVMRGGRAVYKVSVVMRPDQLGRVIKGQGLEKGAFATILDQEKIVVWRNSAAERFIGRPATADIQRALTASSQGVRDSVSLEGVPTVAAFSRSPFSGWTFVIAVPRSEMRAGTYRAFGLAGAAAALLLCLGALLGLVAARRVARATRNLAAVAGQAEQGLTASYRRSGLREIDAAGEALVGALQARTASEERYRRIFEQTSDLIMAADLDQVITDCNPAAAAAVGLTREQAIGRKISDFVSADDFDRTTEMLRHKLVEGGSTRYDVRVRSSTGELLFWEVNSGLTYASGDKPVGIHVVARDVTERKQAEATQLLLINELNHRVKNTLAVVQGIAHQTFRDRGADRPLRHAFEGRLAALSAAHDVLTREGWSSAPLAEIVANAVAPFCAEERCSASGPELRLNPRAAVSMALAVHELATNAVKYGALSNPLGRVLIAWRVENGRFGFRWEERDGPPVTPPLRRGFGSRMIERGLAADLGGTATMDFSPAGLVFELDAPLPQPE